MLKQPASCAIFPAELAVDHPHLEVIVELQLRPAIQPVDSLHLTCGLQVHSSKDIPTGIYHQHWDTFGDHGTNGVFNRVHGAPSYSQTLVSWPPCSKRVLPCEGGGLGSTSDRTTSLHCWDEPVQAVLMVSWCYCQYIANEWRFAQQRRKRSTGTESA